MVGEDGRAVPLGRAPDHHVQKAVRRLDVMLLEGRDSAGHSGQPPVLALSGNDAVGQPGGCWASGGTFTPIGWGVPFSPPPATPREDRPEGAPLPKAV